MTRKRREELARALNKEDPAKAGDNDEYTTWEHLERLKYLEIIPSKDDAIALKKLSSMLASKIPGLGEFVNEERYVMLKGKLAYNTYATYTDAFDIAVEGDKAVKDFYRGDGSARPKGLALYLVTAYLNHTCHPNVKLSFSAGTIKVAVVATQPIKKGEELYSTYINTQTDRPYESRSKELMDKFRLKCYCSSCSAEQF